MDLKIRSLDNYYNIIRLNCLFILLFITHTKNVTVHSGDSLFFQTSVAIVIGFLAEMGRIPCFGRPEFSPSII